MLPSLVTSLFSRVRRFPGVDPQNQLCEYVSAIFDVRWFLVPVMLPLHRRVVAGARRGLPASHVPGRHSPIARPLVSCNCIRNFPSLHHLFLPTDFFIAFSGSTFDPSSSSYTTACHSRPLWESPRKVCKTDPRTLFFDVILPSVLFLPFA